MFGTQLLVDSAIDLCDLDVLRLEFRGGTLEVRSQCLTMTTPRSIELNEDETLWVDDVLECLAGEIEDVRRTRGSSSCLAMAAFVSKDAASGKDGSGANGCQ